MLETVIGVETHVQLKTRTKLFCGCEVRFGAPPNSLTCPVCLGHPGALPVLNTAAFRLGIRAALALGCAVLERTKFDRKNYFYPDLPKNYQITQYDEPIARTGGVSLGGRRVRIERIHLEEDAGKLIHEEDGDRTLVDLNRAGTPLIEIVTHPDLDSGEATVEYLAELKSILQFAGISDCDMEKGELRCDVNLSLRPEGSPRLGVKVEIKNLNSFRFAKAAIEFEERRQRALLESGGIVVQETRLYDPDRDETRPMRTKEDVHDYRYFPEPDLPPLRLSAAEIERIRTSLPESPGAMRERFRRSYALGDYDARLLTADRGTALFFDAVAGKTDPKTAANWIANDLAGILRERNLSPREIKLTPEAMAELIGLVLSGTINGATAKSLLPELVEDGGSAGPLVASRGLAQVRDTGVLEEIVRGVLRENTKAVEEFRAGKERSLQFLIGRVMKETKGRADPGIAQKLLRKLLIE